MSSSPGLGSSSGEELVLISDCKSWRVSVLVDGTRCKSWGGSAAVVNPSISPVKGLRQSSPASASSSDSLLARSG